MKQIRKRLTYANVMSSIAVFLMLGGATAIAAKSILPKNSVGTKQLKKNAVTTAKIKGGAVNAGKLANGAVLTDKLADAAVTTGKLANDAVVTDKIAADAVTGAKVNESTLGQVPNAANAEKLGGKSVNDVAMWAFVGANGGLLRSSGGITSSRAGTGSYSVNFPRTINTCASNATNAAVDTAPNPLPAQIALAALDADTVRVQTGSAADGTLTDDQFMLVVTC